VDHGQAKSKGTRDGKEQTEINKVSARSLSISTKITTLGAELRGRSKSKQKRDSFRVGKDVKKKKEYTFWKKKNGKKQGAFSKGLKKTSSRCERRRTNQEWL